MASTIDPTAIFTQLIGGYIKLPLMQKIIYPVLIVASVAGIIYISEWANRPDYAVLFSNLESADSAVVIERLKEQKISYEIRGDGSTIAISPPDMIHELRISLASEGVPKGGVVGLEIFDATSFGMTTFQEKIKFMRAIQGELERTIASLDVIASARVHVTQPEKSVFANKNAKATASVMLKLKVGGELSATQIKGIAHLVAGSVEGLDVEGVSIVDVQGNLLTETEGSAEEFGQEATRLQYQREVEQGYVRRIEQMLTKILGPGKAIARVTAELDFSTLSREEESYDPGGQVIRSERSIEEGVGSSQRGGVPGVVSNLSNDETLIAPNQAGSNNSKSRKETVRNFEVSRAVTQTTSSRGKLVKLSVAVVVDGTYDVPEGATGEAEKIYSPLEADVTSQIETLVKNAVGFDVARGDTLTVENIPFFVSQDDFAEEMKDKEASDLIFNVIYRVGPLLFLLLFFLVIVRPLVKFLVTPTEAEMDLQRLLPTGISELEEELEAEQAKASIPKLDQSIDLAQLEELMSENSKVVKENPQQAALLIRYWLNDGRI